MEIIRMLMKVCPDINLSMEIKFKLKEAIKKCEDNLEYWAFRTSDMDMSNLCRIAGLTEAYVIENVNTLSSIQTYRRALNHKIRSMQVKLLNSAIAKERIWLNEGNFKEDPIAYTLASLMVRHGFKKDAFNPTHNRFKELRDSICDLNEINKLNVCVAALQRIVTGNVLRVDAGTSPSLKSVFSETGRTFNVRSFKYINNLKLEIDRVNKIKNHEQSNAIEDAILVVKSKLSHINTIGDLHIAVSAESGIHKSALQRTYRYYPSYIALVDSVNNTKSLSDEERLLVNALERILFYKPIILKGTYEVNYGAVCTEAGVKEPKPLRNFPILRRYLNAALKGPYPSAVAKVMRAANELIEEAKIKKGDALSISISELSHRAGFKPGYLTTHRFKFYKCIRYYREGIFDVINGILLFTFNEIIVSNQNKSKIMLSSLLYKARIGKKLHLIERNSYYFELLFDRIKEYNECSKVDL